MKAWMESYAAKLTAGVHTIGVGLDPDILMLPGGSLVALVLWLYEHRPYGKALPGAPIDKTLH